MRWALAIARPEPGLGWLEHCLRRRRGSRVQGL